MNEVEALEAAKFIVQVYYNATKCKGRKWKYVKDSEISIKKIINGDTLFIIMLAVENDETKATGDNQLYLVVYDKLNNKISTYLYMN